MSIKTLYPKLSKWSFVTFLLAVAATIIISKTLPDHKEVTAYNEQCYWTNALIVYIECGTNVPLKGIIEVVLNMVCALAIIPLVPFYILLFPPFLWAFVISFYFLAASYFISGIRKRFSSKPAPEKSERFYKIIKRIFIFLLVASVAFQMRLLYKEYLVNTIYWKAKLGIVNNKFENNEDYSRAIPAANFNQ